MKGFRNLRGVNWLDEVHYCYYVSQGETLRKPIGKLPLHWNEVRNILLK